ncbi:hypothetical protein WS72_27995 [Burkholderia savannae]|uniref:Uncharacterized protein n=1 Tax=Burkholderia savannae TaxID=1637837 RepID=A0ABR5T618_9BURK|nr:hypothetical protein WS72_27995 [Burkholderia savannae]
MLFIIESRMSEIGAVNRRAETGCAGGGGGELPRLAGGGRAAGSSAVRAGANAAALHRTKPSRKSRRPVSCHVASRNVAAHRRATRRCAQGSRSPARHTPFRTVEP